MAEAVKDKLVKLVNTTSHVVVSGQVRIMPAGSPGDTLEILESRISEGLKRLIGAGLKKTE